jgi:hypothetical protein
MPPRGKRRAIVAWLGLFALTVQVLIPLILGAEITLAASGSEPDVFDLCSLHHVDAAPPGGTGKSDRHGGHHLCPICLALLASPAFTQTAAPSLPPPTAHAAAIERLEKREVPHRLVLLSYRSRAPPIA